MSKKIVILGSTGSVGTQCLEIIRKFPDDFSVLGLSAGKNFKLFQRKYLRKINYAINIKNRKSF